MIWDMCSDSYVFRYVMGITNMLWDMCSVCYVLRICVQKVIYVFRVCVQYVCNRIMCSTMYSRYVFEYCDGTHETYVFSICDGNNKYVMGYVFGMVCVENMCSKSHICFQGMSSVRM